MVTHRPLSVHFPPCGVFVIESHHADDFRMEWTEHSFLKLLYVIDGKGRLLIRGGSLSLGPSRIVLIPPGERHRITDETPMSLYALCLRTESLPAVDTAKAKLSSLFHPALSETAERLLKEMLYEQTVQLPGWQSMLAGRALMLWSGWIRWQEGQLADPASLGTSNSYLRVSAYIEEAQRSFYRREKMESVALRCGLSVRRFTQIFRTLTGQSWLSYLRDKRIAHACRLLQETTRSITSVCFECGFEDLSNFYRAFSQACGVSPQRWREAYPSKPVSKHRKNDAGRISHYSRRKIFRT